MEITDYQKDNYIVLNLTGSLDIYTSIDLKNTIEEKVGEKPMTLVINLDKVSYVDSSGIGTLIKTFNLMEKNNGDFVIANLKPIIEKVFKVAGLTSYFKIIDQDELQASYPA